MKDKPKFQDGGIVAGSKTHDKALVGPAGEWWMSKEQYIAMSKLLDIPEDEAIKDWESRPACKPE